MKLSLKAITVAIANLSKSQAEIAREAGMNASHFSRIVNGHILPNRSTIGKIAKALNVPVESIITDQEEA